MKVIEVEYPKIPEDGWFKDWALDIITGGDEGLKSALKK